MSKSSLYDCEIRCIRLDAPLPDAPECPLTLSLALTHGVFGDLEDFVATLLHERASGSGDIL